MKLEPGARSYDTGELEKEAALLPRNLIEGMNQRDGENEGGLTLPANISSRSISM